MIYLEDQPTTPTYAYPLERHQVETTLVTIICISTIVTNAIAILSVATSVFQRESIDYYLLSLLVCDLLCGIFILPLSIYSASTGEWIYGDFLCKLTGYMEITLWTITVYTFMWMSVDRYLAIRKPLRYVVLQTRTRCQCWVLFTWLTSVFLCSPPLLGFSTGNFYKDGYICTLDLKNMIPYSITLAILVLAPSVITILYSYFFIFITMYRLRQYMTQEEREYATATSENLSNPDHMMSFILTIVFWISWFPWFGLRIWEEANGYLTDHYYHFFFLWFGILDCVWKPLIYASISPKFRIGMRVFCTSLCCRRKFRQQLIV
ncbi:histamine H2 receptor-like [Centruroides sculpturatus]|uniref:histamine H2 receptor-like n=1 Tax=Centruroides sculpturatus TaxID=218467 RepID=UPI000C6CEB20|nr:histamine H2 receptor-like [Centruroides sculpturatus]